jgi:hypothetical protein
MEMHASEPVSTCQFIVQQFCRITASTMLYTEFTEQFRCSSDLYEQQRPVDCSSHDARARFNAAHNTDQTRLPARIIAAAMQQPERLPARTTHHKTAPPRSNRLTLPRSTSMKSRASSRWISTIVSETYTEGRRDGTDGTRRGAAWMPPQFVP